MPDFSPVLQTGNDPIALAEWFVASLLLVIVVTLIYVFVLNKSPPPEGITVSKVESMQSQALGQEDPHPTLQQAENALQSNDYKGAVEYSVQAVGLCLNGLVKSSFGKEISNASISDLAYLVETKATSAPQIAQPIYQLNSLRLRVLQGQPVEQQEASWGVSLATWLVSSVESQQIKL